MAETSRVKSSECPSCHRTLDAATFPFTGKGKPTAGDYTLCIYCCALAVFTKQGKLRQPTYEEMKHAKQDPKVQFIRESIVKMNSMYN